MVVDHMHIYTYWERGQIWDWDTYTWECTVLTFSVPCVFVAMVMDTWWVGLVSRHILCTTILQIPVFLLLTLVSYPDPPPKRKGLLKGCLGSRLCWLRQYLVDRICFQKFWHVFFCLLNRRAPQKSLPMSQLPLCRAKNDPAIHNSHTANHTVISSYSTPT